MNQHLTTQEMDLLLDGEAPPESREALEAHLAACQQCAAAMLPRLQLKQLTRSAGLRYQASPGFERRILATIAPSASAGGAAAPAPAPLEFTSAARESAAELRPHRTTSPAFTRRLRPAVAGLSVLLAACLLLAVLFFAPRRPAAQDALTQEQLDQHIAMLAANTPPQIVSSSKHVVRPWFQGKLPFTFNTPDTLPAETALVGGNLVYLRGKPAADLIFKIRQHYVSVFLTQRDPSAPPPARTAAATRTASSGFQVRSASTAQLNLTAISDDTTAADLDALITAIQSAQLP